MDLPMEQAAIKALLKALNKLALDGDEKPEPGMEMMMEEGEQPTEEVSEESKPEVSMEIETAEEPEDDMEYIKKDMKKMAGSRMANLPFGGKKSATAGQAEIEIGPIKKLKKALG